MGICTGNHFGATLWVYDNGEFAGTSEEGGMKPTILSHTAWGYNQQDNIVI